MSRPDSVPDLAVRAPKLRPIILHTGVVRRSALLDRIRRSHAPIVAVVAPAGYGKTTMLMQLADGGGDPIAWLSTDDGDNDPAVLSTDLAAALDRLAPFGSRVCAAAASQAGPVALGAMLVEAIEAVPDPFTLVIDQLEFVTNPECLDIIVKVAVGLPEGARLVLSSRAEPRLPTPRWRVEGRLLEIGARDLAFAPEEARGLLVAAGVDLAAHDVDTLVDRTEGWAAGLYLAGLAITVGKVDNDTAVGVSGDHRIVGDYLRAEILDRLSPQDASFLRRISILDSVCGALCDAMLGVTDSAARLETFERRNLLVVPLDDRREWYRFHRLFGELLRSELHRREPQYVTHLHARAAEWYQANGRLEHTLEHAQAANDHDLVAQLLSDLIQPAWASGHAETVRRWLAWLADNNLLDRYPALTAHGALMYALDGHPATAEIWSLAAERGDVAGHAPDGSSVESILAYMRACLCRDGVAAMRADAISACDGLSPTSPFRASMMFTEGLSHLIEGDTQRAERLLVRAADAGMAIDAVPFAAMVFAVLGQIATSRDHWNAANDLGERALDLVGNGAYDEYWSSAPVFAFGARIAIESRRIDVARTQLARAARLRPLLTYALPVMSVITLLEMARCYLALTDRAGALAVLGQAHGILQQRPALGLLGRQADELNDRVESNATIFTGGSSLTAAELRLAPFLATHLTLQEIGNRLHISRSTAKTEAVAIYHKLGAGSRSEAVDKLRDLGLLRL